MKILKFFPFIALALALQLGSSSAETCPRILHVHPRYITEDAMLRIGDYMTHKNWTGRHPLITPSNASCRDGLYFILTFNKNTKNLCGQTLTLHYIRSDGPTQYQKTFQIPATSSRWNRELYVGLTGSDWPSSCVNVVAWMIEFNGCQTTSYLWRINN